MLLLVKRNKEREVGPVPIPLIAHVVTNSVKSNKKMFSNSITSRILWYRKINFIALSQMEFSNVCMPQYAEARLVLI